MSRSDVVGAGGAIRRATVEPARGVSDVVIRISPRPDEIRLVRNKTDRGKILTIYGINKSAKVEVL